MLANMCVAVSQSTRLCSMSTVSQEKPQRARKRDAVMLPSDSQVPTDALPAFRAAVTALERIKNQSSWKRRFGGGSLREGFAGGFFEDGGWPPSSLGTCDTSSSS